MKRIIVFALVVAALAGGCASYEVNTLDESGQITGTYRTAEVYVGTGILPLDIIVDSILLIPGIFYDEPMLLASHGTVIGGMGVPMYVKRVALPGGRILPPNMLPALSSDAGPWIEFTDEFGNQVSIVGQRYTVETVSSDVAWE